MKITRQMLVEKDACAPGLDFFDERFPSGETPEFNWTPEMQLIVLCFAPKWFDWLTQDTNLLPVFSMRGTDLRWADLRWANLQGADLRGSIHNERTQWPTNFDMDRLK